MYKRTLKQQFIDELRSEHGDSAFRFTDACYLYIDIQRRRGSRSTSAYRTRPMGISEGPRGVSLGVARILKRYATRSWAFYKNGELRPMWRMLSLEERVDKHCARRDGNIFFCSYTRDCRNGRKCSRCTYLD
jgi:hypothetical protein